MIIYIIQLSSIRMIKYELGSLQINIFCVPVQQLDAPINLDVNFGVHFVIIGMKMNIISFIYVQDLNMTPHQEIKQASHLSDSS